MTSDEIERLRPGDLIRYGDRGAWRVILGSHSSPRRSTKPFTVYGVTVLKLGKRAAAEGETTILDRWTLRTKCERAGLRLKNS